MAEHTTLYQNVKYYDIALQRDVSREVDFLIDLYRLHHKSDLRSVLDIACGPGYHARAFSKCGFKAMGPLFKARSAKSSSSYIDKTIIFISGRH